MNTIKVRKFDPADIEVLIKLFKEAVSNINIRHYSAEQIKIWIQVDRKQWLESLKNNLCFVAEIDGVIVGFADMTIQGYLDRLYINKDYQGRFIYLYLLREIEKSAQSLGLKKIITHCSITAKVPAERAGFKVIKEQQAEKAGIYFTNFLMEKDLK